MLESVKQYVEELKWLAENGIEVEYIAINTWNITNAQGVVLKVSTKALLNYIEDRKRAEKHE